MDRIAKFLNQHIVGNVFDKLSIREAYSADRSILSTVPRMVAIPESTTDLRKIVRFSNQLAERDFRLPITIRGGGNDKTGASVSSGLLISMEKLNKIQEIDVRNRLVRVQAGITLQELNAALSLHGLTIPIAGHKHDTIGGLIANCPADDYASKYGGIYNIVQQIEVVLSNSNLLQTQTLRPRALEKQKQTNSFTSTIYRDIDTILSDYWPTVRELSVQPLDSAGYATSTLVRDENTFSLLPLFFNSQGTLGIISEVILKAVPLPADIKHIMITSRNIRPAVDLLHYIMTREPLSLNIYSASIFGQAMKYGNCSKLFKQEPKGELVIVASFNYSARKNRRIMRDIVAHLPRNSRAIMEDQTNSLDFQALQSMVNSYLNDGIRGERVAIADDARVFAEQLPSFIADVKELGKAMHIDTAIFGSFATSNYSVRPEMVLNTIGGRKTILQFLRKYNELVEKHHGSITGGGPEGSVKALVHKLTPTERKLYTAIKLTFDPQNILNPHIKLGANPRTSIHRLRKFYKNYLVEP